jgi:transcriptional regulator with XRE-family HTH domain
MTKTTIYPPPPSCAAAALHQLLGADLRQLRERHGLTAAELGERIGMSTSGVCRVERGGRFPRPATVLRLVSVLRQLEGKR